MQRNENNFFCVSTNNGQVIPNTETTPGSSSKLIDENICQQYSDLCK